MERFWPKVEITKSCWIWKGYISYKGYGTWKHDIPGYSRQAHRFAYQQLVGPIPDGLVMDHLCRNRACVNPDHVEPVTPKVNSERGIAGAVNAARMKGLTHCKRGHEFTAANTYWRPRPYGQSQHRQCRTCRRAEDKQRKAERRQQRLRST